MKELNAAELHRRYIEGEQADQELFAEQRSNILLVAGEHYTRKNSKFWVRIRDNKEMPTEAKLRLTKNHSQKIVKKYVNSITNLAPGVSVFPHNDSELQDQKAAQLNQAVWVDIKNKQRYREKVLEYANDFIGVGEVAVKAFWDNTKGEYMGEQPVVNEFGEPEIDEATGQPKTKPVFSGDIVWERVFAANLKRAVEAKSWEASPYLMYSKMVNVDDLKDSIDDPAIKEKIHSTPDNTFMVFDGASTSYKNEKNQAMLVEHYYKPCPQFPKGYYFICLEEVILWQGELPGGIYPIIFTGFDEIQTSPRYQSILKVTRPYQIEINRSASKMAEHQITLGDDKIIMQSGAKLTNGPVLPGVRGYYVSGMNPTVMEGRSGAQYLEYMNSQITEMYQAASVDEQEQEKDLGNDPMLLMYRSLREKKKFSTYAVKFENFLARLCETSLDLARFYYTPQHIVYAIGRREMVNIPEFKTTQKACYSVKIEPLSDDIETKMGKMLSINHALQYVGNQLGKEDIGKLIRAYPYLNEEESFKDFTLDYDIATNYILALDRGELPTPNMYDNHEYLIKRIVDRMRESDFQMLSPQIQYNYNQAKSVHEQMKVQQMEMIKQAQSQFIPSGGFLVACDFYVDDKKNPDKLPKRLRVPSEALDWLKKQLDSQGTSQQQLENMNQGAVQEIAQRLLKSTGGRTGQANPMLSSNGQASPGGINGY